MKKLLFCFFLYCTARQHPAQKASTQRHGYLSVPCKWMYRPIPYKFFTTRFWTPLKFCMKHAYTLRGGMATISYIHLLRKSPAPVRSTVFVFISSHLFVWSSSSSVVLSSGQTSHALVVFSLICTSLKVEWTT